MGGGFDDLFAKLVTAAAPGWRAALLTAQSQAPHAMMCCRYAYKHNAAVRLGLKASQAVLTRLVSVDDDDDVADDPMVAQVFAQLSAWPTARVASADFAETLHAIDEVWMEPTLRRHMMAIVGSSDEMRAVVHAVVQRLCIDARGHGIPIVVGGGGV